MKPLYPSSEPYAVHSILVDEPHQLYVEECGNPQGLPVIFLHGGPGSGCSVEHRRYFDPDFYRIILFDQRGSGRSTPLGEITRNRTEDLLLDMETIRCHLNIEQWMLFGGSWGATVALLYAIAYARRVSGMILRGTFLARETDLDWFFVGMKRILPQAWAKLTQEIAQCHTFSDVIDAYHTALHGEDRSIALQAASRWSEWGNKVVSWHMRQANEQSNKEHDIAEKKQRMLAKVQIESHYAQQRYFISENEILTRIGSLPAIPVAIVHGRFDLVCTLEAAWLLHRAIPASRFIQVADAGHLIDEAAMASALIEETDRMRDLLQDKP